MAIVFGSDEANKLSKQDRWRYGDLPDPPADSTRRIYEITTAEEVTMERRYRVLAFSEEEARILIESGNVECDEEEQLECSNMIFLDAKDEASEHQSRWES